MKLVPWSPAPKRTLWLDVVTGAACDDDGRPGDAGGVQLVGDVLRHAETTRSERVMLTGPVRDRGWYLDALPEGWTHGGHFLDHDVPVGRYQHVSGARVEVRRAAEWFGAGTYDAVTARTAWRVLADTYARQVRGGSLFASPGATGLDGWLRSLPRAKGHDGPPEAPEQVPGDVAELLRATSPQHRIERIAPPSTGATAPALWYLDGRWMYAALCRELGTAPVTRLTAAAARELLHSERGAYARARYLVTFAAPAGWDAPGILLEKAGERVHDGWHAPLAGKTWADASEVHLALQMGWTITTHEGLLFTKGRPLDTWASRLQRAREDVDDLAHGAEVAGMVRAGVRAILLHAVGAWHSSGRDETTVTEGRMSPPAGDGWGAPQLVGDVAVWRRRHELDGRAGAMTHPEWSSQIWGRAHARILSSPTSEPGVMAGALYLRPGTLVGIYGDAVMTSTRPHWADLDDGANGRLRVKGHLCGPVPWPTRASERDELARAADVAGSTCPKGTCS